MNDTRQAAVTLRGTGLFEGISDTTIDAIAAAAKAHRYEEGDTVYELGDDARDVFVVVDGRVRFSLGVSNRVESAGSIFEGGEVFGWAALVEQPRRVATALCLEPSTLLSIPGDRLLAVLEKNPEDGFVVLRRLAVMIARNFIT